LIGLISSKKCEQLSPNLPLLRITSKWLTWKGEQHIALTAQLCKLRIKQSRSHASKALLGGLRQSGWRVAYTSDENAFEQADEGPDAVDASFSIGFSVKGNGVVGDVISGRPAFEVGLGPGRLSESERDFIGVQQIAALVRSLWEEFSFPIFLNADHTHSDEGCGSREERI
jgi:hypothetical protein